MKKTRVAVIFGGRSTEHEISVITAIDAMGAIDVLRYEVVPVYISQNGKWYSGDSLRERAFYKSLPGSLKNVEEVTLLPQPGVGGLVKRKQKSAFGKLFSSDNDVIPVDVFLPLFHGTYGEDGCIQGLFELADVTYAGCSVLPSAVAMNKPICKSVFKEAGIPVLPDLTVEKSEMNDLDALHKKIAADTAIGAPPFFVKPSHLGSSVGISKATTYPELTSALLNVFSFDTHALIEPYLAEMFEINVSVVTTKDGPRASVVEIPVRSGDALSYEDKYLRGGGKKKGGGASQGMAGLVRSIDPDDLEDHFKEDVIKYAIAGYREIGCRGVVRFDFMVNTKTGALYFNELNPLPGSIAFYLWEKSKPPLLYTQLITTIIEDAFRARDARTDISTDFGFKALSAN